MGRIVGMKKSIKRIKSLELLRTLEIFMTN